MPVVCLSPQGSNPPHPGHRRPSSFACDLICDEATTGHRAYGSMNLCGQNLEGPLVPHRKICCSAEHPSANTCLMKSRLILRVRIVTCADSRLLSKGETLIDLELSFGWQASHPGQFPRLGLSTLRDLQTNLVRQQKSPCAACRAGNWAVLRSPAKSLPFSGLNANPH